MKKVLIIFMCLILSGCSSPGRKAADFSPVKERSMPINGISVQEKLQLYKKICEEPVSGESDVFAKDLTLTALTKALKSSDAIAAAPVYKFNEIDLRKIEYEELCHRYRVLNKLMYAEKIEDKTDPDYIDADGNQYWFNASVKDAGMDTRDNGEDKAEVLEIMRVTALCSMGKEIEKRGSKTEFWKDLGAATTKATGIALRLALTLAKYMI